MSVLGNKQIQWCCEKFVIGDNHLFRDMMETSKRVKTEFLYSKKNLNEVKDNHACE